MFKSSFSTPRCHASCNTRWIYDTSGDYTRRAEGEESSKSETCKGQVGDGEVPSLIQGGLFFSVLSSIKDCQACQCHYKDLLDWP